MNAAESINQFTKVFVGRDEDRAKRIGFRKNDVIGHAWRKLRDVNRNVSVGAKASDDLLIHAFVSEHLTCGDRYTEGTSVTKNELGWVHEECAAP